MNPQELKERTKQFAPWVNVGGALAPRPRGWQTVGALRPLPHLEEEADETALWLELITADKILSEKKVVPLLNEANELVAIMAASYISAARNKRDVSAQKRQSSIRNHQSEIRI